MTRSVVTPLATRARPGPSHRVRHPDRGDPRRPGDPVPEEATAQSAGRGPGHGVSPPVLSLSGFPGLAGLGTPRDGARGRLEHARDAGPRGERGAHGRSHRALSLRSRRAPLRPAGLEGAWPSRRRGRGRGVGFPGLGSRPHPAHSRRGAPGEQVAGTREALDGRRDRSIDSPGTLLHPRLGAPNRVRTNFAHPFPMSPTLHLDPLRRSTRRKPSSIGSPQTALSSALWPSKLKPRVPRCPVTLLASQSPLHPPMTPHKSSPPLCPPQEAFPGILSSRSLLRHPGLCRAAGDPVVLSEPHPSSLPVTLILRAPWGTLFPTDGFPQSTPSGTPSLKPTTPYSSTACDSQAPPSGIPSLRGGAGGAVTTPPPHPVAEKPPP